MTHLVKTAAAALTFAVLSAVPAVAAVNSKADCEYEGGEVYTVEEGTVCIVPVRPEDYRGEAYDGQQLGIDECTGTKLNEGAFCKIVLVPAPKKAEAPAPTEVEEMADEEMAKDDE